MKHLHYKSLILGVATLLISCLTLSPFPAQAQEQPKPLNVCATVEDLASLINTIGGQHVSVTTFAKGTEDPHFIEAKPSFIKKLSKADMFVQIGMGMETAWVPSLLKSSRNPNVQKGSYGYINASQAIVAMQLPTESLDRSMGDVHPKGNPHYLLDPLNGLKVAQRICEILGDLRPEKKDYFEQRYQAFVKEVHTALFGEKLLEHYSGDELSKLALLFEHGKLAAFLKEQEQEDLLGGWLTEMLPHVGSKVVVDHNMWPYFARRFGLKIKAYLEPKPGIAPSSKHLASVVKLMRKQKIRTIVKGAYFNPRHATFVAEHSSATIAELAHQVGARKGTSDYITMFNYNIKQLKIALKTAKGN